MKHLKPLITALLTLALLAAPAAVVAKRGDRDRDGMRDRWERRHHLNVRANDARRDPDHDGLRNLAEFRRGTDPRDADTDDDGIDDGDELRFHSNPRSDDSDDDGIDDGDELTGTVVSFENGRLTIRLAGDGGDTVTGMVTDATEIECEDDDGDRTASASDDSNSGPGSDSSDASDSSDDRGDDDADDDDLGDDEDDDDRCGAADLVAGALVHEAELKPTDSGAVFTEVELIPSA